MTKTNRMGIVSAVNLFALFIVGTLYIAFLGRFGTLFGEWFIDEVRNGFYIFGTILGIIAAIVWLVLLFGHLGDIYEEKE